MLARRSAIGAFLMIPVAVLSTPARAQDDPALPPEVQGLADFAVAWSPDQDVGIELFAAEPDIPAGIAELFSTVIFRTYADLVQHFQTAVGTDYITWFNAQLAGKSEWAERSIAGPGVRSNFENFWTEYLPQRPLSLLEFVAYMAIFTNECSGNLVSVTEAYGSKDHPGITYLFDSIRRTLPDGRTWSKRSYNTGQANRTALSLFQDPLFNAAHGTLPLSVRVRAAPEPAWSGDQYPVPAFPTTGDPAITGYVLETDFFKFRGRGLIQTTWRSNYRPLAEFIRSYSGSSPIVREYRDRWARYTADEACTISSNTDWDRLFKDPAQVLLCESIRQHARNAHYFPLAATTPGLNAPVDQPGSIGCMGLRIGGGKAYAAKFKGRVREMCNALL